MSKFVNETMKIVCVKLPRLGRFQRYTEYLTIGKTYDVVVTIQLYKESRVWQGAWYVGDDGKNYIFNQSDLGDCFKLLEEVRSERLSELGI